MLSTPRRLLLIAVSLILAGCLFQTFTSFNAWMATMDFEIRPGHQVPRPSDLKTALFVFYAWSAASLVAAAGLVAIATFPILRRLLTPPPKSPDQEPWH